MAKIKPNQKFGKWIALNTISILCKSGKKITKWKVKCECGEVSNVSSYDLIHGKSTKCRKCHGTDVKNLQGKTFGRWKVIKKGEKKNGKTHWICICSCGLKENVCSASLLNGVSSKCKNCYRNEMHTHGYTRENSKHPLYSLWMTMIARCENPKNISYKNYGARGIKVCKQWHNLENFSRDMGERPLKCSIDRIDCNDNYSPENCRWADQKQQANNKRTNFIIEYDGEEKTLTEWAERLDVKVSTLHKYITKYNHSFKEAFVHYSKSKN